MAGKRKPVLAPAGHLDRRDRIWAEIRRLRTFTWLQLSDATGLPPERMLDYLQALRQGGYLTVSRAQIGQRAVHRLVKDTGVETPRVRPDGSLLPPSRQQKLWAAMRSLQTFDVQGLALSAGVPVSTAQRYATALVRAGYLVSRRGHPYRLLPGRITGPRAPKILRGKRIHDPNLGREVTAESWAELPTGRRR